MPKGVDAQHGGQVWDQRLGGALQVGDGPASGRVWVRGQAESRGTRDWDQVGLDVGQGLTES